MCALDLSLFFNIFMFSCWHVLNEDHTDQRSVRDLQGITALDRHRTAVLQQYQRKNHSVHCSAGLYWRHRRAFLVFFVSSALYARASTKRCRLRRRLCTAEQCRTINSCNHERLTEFGIHPKPGVPLSRNHRKRSSSPLNFECLWTRLETKCTKHLLNQRSISPPAFAQHLDCDLNCDIALVQAARLDKLHRLT